MYWVTPTDDRKMVCPTGCTQRRTEDNRLTEKRTFDGSKCQNCGFEVRYDTNPTYRKCSIGEKTSNF